MKTIAVITPPAIEPLSLQEVKTFLKIDYTEHDAYLTGLITAVRQSIEDYLGRALITQTRRMSFDDPFAFKLVLWYPAIQSITHIKTFNRLNEESTIQNSNYFLKDDILYLNESFPWPSDLRPLASIEITYICGYGNSALAVPFAIKQAMYELIQFMYECKCSEITMPERVKALLNFYKVYVGRLA